MNNTANLLWSILFGAIGSAYLLYARKQRRTVALICGFLLIGFPYFIDNTVILAAIGLALCAAPYFFR